MLDLCKLDLKEENLYFLVLFCSTGCHWVKTQTLCMRHCCITILKFILALLEVHLCHFLLVLHFLLQIEVPCFTLMAVCKPVDSGFLHHLLTGNH